jgi:hypothetical protein
MEHELGHFVVWDENLSIVSARGVGLIDEAAAAWFLECTEKMAQRYGGQIDWLLDLSQMKKVSFKARPILAKASGHPSIRRYAFWGASTLIRTLANFISAAAGQQNSAHFASQQEALQWLDKG